MHGPFMALLTYVNHSYVRPLRCHGWGFEVYRYFGTFSRSMLSMFAPGPTESVPSCSAKSIKESQSQDVSSDLIMFSYLCLSLSLYAIYIYIYYIYIYMCVCVCACVYANLYVYIYIYIHIFLNNILLHYCILSYIIVFISIYLYIYIYIYIYIDIKAFKPA